MRKQASQALWTEGEALERAGRKEDAVRKFVESALAEESEGKPLRARLLWEGIAARAGTTGTVLERLAQTSGRAQLHDDALDYWVAAAVRYREDGRTEDAARALMQARSAKAKTGPHETVALARATLERADAAERALLA